MRRAIQIFCSIVLLAVACAPRVIRPKGSLQPAPGIEPGRLEGAFGVRRMALLVGINDFDDHRWRPLRYAEKDASDFASVLEDPARGGFSDVTVLSGMKNTTRAAILEAIDRLARTNTNPDDTVLIYFSTHGTLERSRSGELKQYLVTSDTRFDDIQETAIDMAELQALFGTLKSRRKVLILATCHSGQGKSELNPRMTEELRRTKASFFVKPLDTVSEASVILSACAWGETAREDDRLGHDIYTYFFIEALSKYDRNDDGAVTVSEAHDYAREQTYYYTHGQQRATALSDILGNDPILLTGKVKRTGKPALYSYQETLNDVEVIVDGTPKGKLPGSIVVEPGIHQVMLVRPDGRTVIFDRSVAFEEGARVDGGELIKHVVVQQAVGLGVSYRGFTSDDVNETVFAPVMMYGIQYSRPAFWRNLMWDLSLYGGVGDADFTIDGIVHKSDVTRFDLEGALLWRYDRGMIAMGGGPSAGMAYLGRKFSDEIMDDSEYILTGTIGGAGFLEFAPIKRLVVGLGGQFYSVPLYIDSNLYFEPAYSASAYLKIRL